MNNQFAFQLENFQNHIKIFIRKKSVTQTLNEKPKFPAKNSNFNTKKNHFIPQKGLTNSRTFTNQIHQYPPSICLEFLELSVLVGSLQVFVWILVHRPRFIYALAILWNAWRGCSIAKPPPTVVVVIIFLIFLWRSDQAWFIWFSRHFFNTRIFAL